MDVFLLVVLVVSLATLLAAHITLAFGLAVRGPWWRGLIAFAVPPLAPFLGMRERMRMRVFLWAAGALGWLGASLAAGGGLSR